MVMFNVTDQALDAGSVDLLSLDWASLGAMAEAGVTVQTMIAAIGTATEANDPQWSPTRSDP